MRELSIEEDQYREILEEYGAKLSGDKISATTMTVPQLEKVLEHFKSIGFKLKHKGRIVSNKDRQLFKIKKTWEALHKGGAMNKPYSDATISKFAFKITGVNRIEWATPTGMAKVIEALKGIAKREHIDLEYYRNTRPN